MTANAAPAASTHPSRSGHRSRRAGLLLTAAALLVASCAMASGPERVLTFEGPESGALFGADDLDEVRIVVTAAFDGDEQAEQEPSVEDLVVLLDGNDVTADAEVGGSVLTYAPDGLADGERRVVIASRPDAGDDGDGAAEPAAPEPLETFTFAIDTVPPDIELTAPEGPLVAGQEVTFAGLTEPGATVQVNDAEAIADDDGNFEVVLAAASEGRVELTATDLAGNRSQDEAAFVVVPSRATVDEVRAVHVSFCGWASPALREPVLQQIEDGLVTAVQLDLKDETGKVGYATEVEFATRIGADSPDCLIDLPAAIEFLHDLDVPVIGRIVAFADPVLAPWAWANDERDLAIQTADGSDFYTGRYNGFANFAHPEIIEYNIAIAEEAAALGVDHILWDYLRKPDGPLENMRIPGLDTSSETAVQDAVTAFTTAADERLAPYGVEHGASLYGVSADRPWEVGQDVEALGEVLDYVAPMIYPSHWGPNEYGVANPLMQPGDMVAATLEVWNEVVADRRARVVPWLEDSNWPIRLGFPDRARYVREQIEATYAAGINEWLLWDSSVRYTESAMVQPPNSASDAASEPADDDADDAA